MSAAVAKPLNQPPWPAACQPVIHYLIIHLPAFNSVEGPFPPSHVLSFLFAGSQLAPEILELRPKEMELFRRTNLYNYSPFPPPTVNIVCPISTVQLMGMFGTITSLFESYANQPICIDVTKQFQTPTTTTFAFILGFLSPLLTQERYALVNSSSSILYCVNETIFTYTIQRCVDWK